MLSLKVTEINSTANPYKVIGYLGGSPVPGAELPINPVNGSFQTVDFSDSTAWQNIDELRIIATTTIKLGIDDLTVSTPVTAASPVDAEAPIISTQPADQTVNVNEPAPLNVAANVTDSGTLSYQWYSNTTNSTSGGTLIPGETNASYTAPTGTAGTTYYYVVVTNTNSSTTGQQTASVTSRVAKVVVNALTNAEAPSITTQPADKTVNVNEPAPLNVAANVTDSGTLSYQWYSNTTNSTSGGTLIPGATNASYTAPTGTAGTTYYYVVVTNTNSSATGEQSESTTSRVAKVVVNALTNAEAPSISTQPADKAVNVNEPAPLNVAANVTDGGTLSYQWYSSTTNSTSGGTLIPGATGVSYTAPTGAAGATYYYVVVTNTNSSATGEQSASTTSRVAKVVVNALTNAEAPSITTQPVDKTVNVNEPAPLNVAANVTDGGTLSYQWYSSTTNSTSGGTLILGATASSYAPPTGAASTTYYYVVVTNTNSSATGEQSDSTTSRVAKVVVNALTNAEAPSISIQPADKTVNIGDAATLEVAASVTDGGTLSYQWYSTTTNSTSGGTLIPGGTGASYTAPTGTAGTTYYYVVVTNTNSSATGEQSASTTSRVAKVVVNALTNAEAPGITTQPADKTVNMGGSATLNVAANVTDGGTLSYQWYSNSMNSTSGGTLIPGATNASYTAPTGTAGTTYYYVVVTNTNSSATGEQSASTTSRVAKVVANALTNAEAPSISIQPADKTVNIGDVAILEVAAGVIDGGELSYQWYSNSLNSTSGGTLIPGATNASYQAPTMAAVTTYYYVVVMNTNSSATGEQSASTTSRVAKVVVNALTNAEAPSITTQPADKTVNIEDAATLEVAASVRDNGTLSYQWYSNTTNSTSGGTLIPGATNASYQAPTMAAVTTYYYVVVTNTNSNATGQKTAPTTSSAAKVSVNVLDSLITLKSSLNPSVQGQAVTLTAVVTAVTALTQDRTPTGSITFKDGNTTLGTAPLNAAGTAVHLTSALAAGSHTITAVYQGDGRFAGSLSNALVQVVNTPVSGGSGGGGSSSPAQPVVPAVPAAPGNSAAPEKGVEVLVNGKVEYAGTSTTGKLKDQTMTTISVDPVKLEDKLAAEGEHAVITIPVKTNSDILIGELNGQSIKNMEEKQAVVQIKTDSAIYTLPAQQINIEAVSSQLGKNVNLQDIKVKIEISAPTADTLKIAETAASQGGFSMMASPLNFKVTGTYRDQSIDVSKFNVYVQRNIVIPDGVDPGKITTGVVVEPDGTVRHVPTKVILENGKYFAQINSLTNSTYTVVWHPLEFEDVETHWAKSAVNDMGSRMIVTGTTEGIFMPDQDITRAEFAAIMVRGLGVKLESGSTSFADISSSSWYAGAVETAYQYHLIQGFEDGTFRPNDKITREQAMKMIAQAMEVTGLSSKLSTVDTKLLLNAFTDAEQVSAWAKSGLVNSLQGGLVSGRNEGKLAPKDNITRAEVAVLIQRLLQKSGLI
ncbi:S-layer homology domain-containing protein [Paenibacillus sp. JX-17]|uniref:S-layer homology domain-containing protein n=1 Tax=Paenibacillus lacisoli TaxID=3064525 RepID=A0ABT9CH89_9BACL|nr:S-layer homology domain-containing protein [Paenibacillus sp. JX-17]MDO7908642.1 S-layer homology domain-containing protein [Paenibacillus sp. JX-17]